MESKNEVLLAEISQQTSKHSRAVGKKKENMGGWGKEKYPSSPLCIHCSKLVRVTVFTVILPDSEEIAAFHGNVHFSSVSEKHHLLWVVGFFFPLEISFRSTNEKCHI